MIPNNAFSQKSQILNKLKLILGWHSIHLKIKMILGTLGSHARESSSGVLFFFSTVLNCILPSE